MPGEKMLCRASIGCFSRLLFFSTLLLWFWAAAGGADGLAQTIISPSSAGGERAPQASLSLRRIYLNTIEPAEASLDSPIVGEFLLDLEQTGDGPEFRRAYQALANSLRVIVGSATPKESAVNLPLPDIQFSGGPLGILSAKGSFVFTLRKGDLPSLSGGKLVVYLQDSDSGTRSNFRTINLGNLFFERAVVFGTIESYVGLGLLYVLFIALFLYILHVMRSRRQLREAASQSPRSTDFANSGTEELVRPELWRPELIPPVPPTSLVAAIAEQRAVLVLGAGASAQAGYPTWETLLLEVADRLGDRVPEVLRRTLGRDGQTWSSTARLMRFSNLMEALQSALGREVLLEEIRHVLDTVNPVDRIHSSLAAIPWAVVLTLAWDNFAEETFTGQRTRIFSHVNVWRSVDFDDPEALLSAVSGGKPVFVRALGNFERPATFSLTIEDFRRMLMRAPEFQRQFALLLQTHRFMFIGVDLDTLKQFLQAIAPDLSLSDGVRHHALVPYGEENTIYSSTLARFGVKIIEYDPRDGFGAVTTFVDKLGRDAKATPARSKAPNPTSANVELAGRRIKRLTLRNIGLFEKLDLTFENAPSEGLNTPWTVFFGPNGSGKSSILRAICLVLAGNDPHCQAAGGRLLKAGTSDGEIELQLGSDVLKVGLKRDRKSVVVTSQQTTPLEAGHALVLGFPALRGAPSAGPPGAKARSRQLPEPADVMPLLAGQVDGRLADFKQWIINTLGDAQRGEQRAKAMIGLVDGIIRNLLPGEFQRLAPLDSSYVIRVRVADDDGPARPDDVPFDDLSQGMASIFNWVGVLTQRLYDFYPEAAKPEEQPAIAIVDEIDAHLHPEWQRRLVDLTRAFFPNVQVVATSHSPLLAGALRRQELCVLERTGRNVVEARVGGIEPYGMNSRDILTSPLFGMETDRNLDAEKKIDEYLRLYRKFERSESEEVALKDLELEMQKIRFANLGNSRINISTFIKSLPVANLSDLQRNIIETSRSITQSSGDIDD